MKVTWKVELSHGLFETGLSVTTYPLAFENSAFRRTRRIELTCSIPKLTILGFRKESFLIIRSYGSFLY